MVKQNKQINDQNSYQLKAHKKKGKQRTSEQKKKKKKQSIRLERKKC